MSGIKPYIKPQRKKKPKPRTLDDIEEANAIADSLERLKERFENFMEVLNDEGYIEQEIATIIVVELGTICLRQKDPRGAYHKVCETLAKEIHYQKKKN